MRKYLLSAILLTLGFTNSSPAQVNYVLNGSFEKYTGCPGDYNEIKNAYYWSGVDSSGTAGYAGAGCVPEFCNTCSTNWCCSIPENSSFYHNARTGAAMAEVTMYYHQADIDRHPIEYLQGRLYNHLTAGRTYCVTFYVCFTGTHRILPSGFAVDHMGAYLDDGSIDTAVWPSCGFPLTFITPQFYETTIITDSVNWTKIQGSFVATGNERFITIGNFFDTTVTRYIDYNPPGPQAYDFAWYLLDDVSVIDEAQKAYAGNDTSINRGDSVFIGSHEDGLPVTWYHLGSSTPLAITGGFWVKPDTTTHYVVRLDLCSGTTYDTMKVTVGRTDVSNISANHYPEVQVFPNPARSDLSVINAAGAGLTLLDMMGQTVRRQHCASDKETISVGDLPPGVYTLQFIFPPPVANGVPLKVIKKLVKEE